MQADLTPELLSPAGNWDCARAAIAAGADAIYFGLPAFNARLRADNFTTEDLPELMAFLHKHGVKGFLTMNTLIFTNELDAAAEQLRLAESSGVDAFIIQDLGLAQMAADLAPNVEIHASTQMTITSPEGLRFIESILPLKRAVLARELSVKEIQKFGKEEHTPLEVFVHGALCVAYSGQCLTSESLGQRSANRGECAQACRMPYDLVIDGEDKPMGEHRYLLSPQDLAAVDLIPDLLQAGVKSYKIEGRLKTPEYVTAVTQAYRKALDAATSEQGNPITPEDHYALEMTFSRGLTTGWLGGTNHPYLTHGRFGKKRGPLLGTITAVQNGWLRLDTPPSEQIPPLKAGDGVVFDVGENRDLEQGASIWQIQGDRIIFHREFSGINFDRIRPGATLYKTADPALERNLRKFWQNAKLPEIKQGLHLVVTGQPGENLVLSTREGVSIKSANSLELAQKHGLTTETLTAQLGRLGNTPYQLASLDNQLEDNCHFPVSQLNLLRRELVAILSQQDSEKNSEKKTVEHESFTHLLPTVAANSNELVTPHLTILCRTLAQLKGALQAGIETIYCDFEDPRRYKEAVAATAAAEHHTQLILATPRIIKAGEIGYLKHIASMKPDGVLIRNLAALDYYKDRSDLIKVGDFSLNTANPISTRILKESGNLDRLTISYDLNAGQVHDLLSQTPPDWLELTLHQHMPLFHMEHCVFCTFMSSGTTYKDCGRPCEEHVVHLRDRVGQLHRLAADVGCRNTLFNGRAQTGAAYYHKLRRTGLSHYRMELLDQDESESLQLIKQYQSFLKGEQSSTQLLATLPALSRLGVTEGTLA